MSVLWIQGHVPKIEPLFPPILDALAKLIRPCYLTDKGALIYMEVPNLTNVAFTWDPKFLKEAEEWREVGRIETYHTCGYIAFFKPSISEVLAQIPRHLLDQCNAFVTLSGDMTACYSEGDGHRTVTILYTAKRIDDEQGTYFPDIGDYLSNMKTLGNIAALAKNPITKLEEV